MLALLGAQGAAEAPRARSAAWTTPRAVAAHHARATLRRDLDGFTACRVLEADDGAEGWCRRCGCAGRPRDTVTRELAHEPLGKLGRTLSKRAADVLAYFNRRPVILS
ncbi:hypothetical protein FXF59_30625 [Microbispora tritici]|uniref:Uncharacterized protein n=2 Tax=Microbispora TaxID=2005 RepID=A0ABY3LQN2_9ACTN|nr:hypothetical protein FED44_20280 [Microbispora fusca]TYB47089.1 hypothetical protein FXF59_30625 [Microbispora tritici]GLW25334.1 hypothetical protein Mame01_53760 [Microbispora amethystogenes]